MSPVATDGFSDLVLHVLAHVPLPSPASLFDPRYVAWVQRVAPAAHVELLHHDAAVLARAWAAGRAPSALQAWPELVGSLDHYRAIAGRELAVLTADQVRSPRVLAALQRGREVTHELLHATLGALVPSFVELREQAIVPATARALDAVGQAYEQALGAVPALVESRVELAWALGARGRAFSSRLVVGVPASWNDQPPEIPVVLAMHEQLVREAGEVGYAAAEWYALTELARRIAAASEPLRRAHVQWLAGLELRALIEPLFAAGTIDRELADALGIRSARRVELLARLAR